MSRTFRRSFYQGDRLTPAEAKELASVSIKGDSFPACYRTGGGEKRFSDGKQISPPRRNTVRFGDTIRFDYDDCLGSKQAASRNRRIADKVACDMGLAELAADRQAEQEELYAFLYWDGSSLSWEDDLGWLEVDANEFDNDYDFGFDDAAFVFGRYY